MRVASPGGLIDSEWPSISSPLLLGGQGLALGTGEVISSPEPHCQSGAVG